MTDFPTSATELLMMEEQHTQAIRFGKQFRALVEAAEPALTFGVEWARKHMDDDHLVTLDHKDEMELAELVLRLCTALAAMEIK